MNPKPLQPPKPAFPLGEIKATIAADLGQLQLHAMATEDSAKMRKLVQAGTHLAMAHALIGQVLGGVGQDVSTEHALQGLQLLVQTPPAQDPA